MENRPKILVVGSLVMDQIMTTAVFPRPGQTVLGKGFCKAPGGKGANQAVQMSRLGADVAMFGKLGHDSNGSELIAACREAGIDCSMIHFDEHEPSACSVIILEVQPDGSTQNRIIVNSGANMSIRPEELKELEDKVASFDMVALQLEIPMQINELIAEYAYKKGVPVMLNSAPYAPLSDSLLSHLSFISPNETEAEDLTGIAIRVDGKVDLTNAKCAAMQLRRKGVKNVLITLGSAGALLLNDDGCIHSPCATNISAVDPTAAGDSFVGAFCYAVCCGRPWEEVLEFANHCAALTVSAMGAMPSLPTLDKVNGMLKSRGKRSFS